MNRLDQEQLGEITRRLVDVLHPQRLYLYGSQTSGSAGADSDIDILVVVPDSAGNIPDLYALAETSLRGTRLPVEVVLCTVSQFDQQQSQPSSLGRIVARKGRLLYAA